MIKKTGTKAWPQLGGLRPLLSLLRLEKLPWEISSSAFSTFRKGIE